MIFKRKNEINEQSGHEKPGFFARLKNGLARTSAGLAQLFQGKKAIDAAIDADLLAELEDTLLLADVGVETTNKIIKQLTQHISRQEIVDIDSLSAALKKEMILQLSPYEGDYDIQGKINSTHKPFIILVMGVNGVGKTTTIGKLAQHFKQQGLRVMLAAGDTFRAAAIEQLQLWGERNHVPVIAQQSGSDSAAVIYDAIQSAKARGIDVLLADTAGRLHTQHNLMEELKKVVRVITKADPSAPHETLLVLDATTGQNALQQATLFNEAAKVSGIVLTKLDGSAKGGIVFALTENLKLPIRFIGVGEQADDLQVFRAEQFVGALLDR